MKTWIVDIDGIGYEVTYDDENSDDKYGELIVDGKKKTIVRTSYSSKRRIDMPFLLHGKACRFVKEGDFVDIVIDGICQDSKVKYKDNNTPVKRYIYSILMIGFFFLMSIQFSFVFICF